MSLLRVLKPLCLNWPAANKINICLIVVSNYGYIYIYIICIARLSWALKALCLAWLATKEYNVYCVFHCQI